MDFLFIPFNNYLKNIGGPSTFMTSLREYLALKDYKVYTKIRDIERSNGVFFSISYDKYFLSMLKNKNLPIIQRIDGVFYPTKHGDKYKELNEDIKDIYFNYSTYIVFQSDYCKKQVFSIFGSLPEEKYTIILNGTNTKYFYPASGNHTNNNSNFKLITTGNFRNIDMLEPIIYALDILSGSYDFTFTIIGPITNKDLLPLIRRPYVKYIKKTGFKKIAAILRKSDIFLYSHLNPPCPNSVIEAISCGIPVVGFDSGSMSELLFFAKDLLVPVSDKIIQEYKEFDPEALGGKIEYTFNNLEMTKIRAIANHTLYPFDKTGDKYIKLFDRLLKNNNA